MSEITIRDVYARFVEIHGPESRCRARWELALVIKSARLRLPEVTDVWLGRIERAWSRGESELPFPTAEENAAYEALRLDAETIR